jgi:hypothetical protein
MRHNAPYSQNQLRDYSSLFTRSEVLNWLKGDLSSIIYKVERYDKHRLSSAVLNHVDFLKHVYYILEAHYQNEYVVKNTFINEFLISEIAGSDSKVFSEYRIGKAVADLAIFNGNSKAFEIKTEFDSDNRLAMQLANYKKAFNQIYLIIPESKLAGYNKYDHNIGLITFKSNGSKNFTVQREAVNRIEIDAETLMQSLHSHEYKSIVGKYFGIMPEMTSFTQFKVCKALMKQIPMEELNTLFIEQMKNRNSKVALSTRYYKEFNQLYLALKMNKSESKRLIQTLKTPLKV